MEGVEQCAVGGKTHRGELVEEVGAPAHSTSLHWLAGAPGQIRTSTVELAGGLVVLLMLQIKLITRIVSHLVICLNLKKTVFTTSQGESYKNRLNFRETQLLITHSPKW